MAAVKKGLGKGLEALFGEEKATDAQNKYTSAQAYVLAMPSSSK